MRPVLYLDIDDTLLSWASGGPQPVPGTAPFIRWARDHYEVRWLTRWCPSGEMPDDLLGDLAKMIGLDPADARTIRACSWEESGIKSDGIAWLEHTVHGREFFWVEDPGGFSPRDREVLQLAGFEDRYIACDVTQDEGALERVREELERAGRERRTAA